MNAVELNREFVDRLLPVREKTAHKGDFGKVLLLCGSRGYTGAAALAAMGALRSGAGLVYLGVPESIYAIEAMKLTEPIVFPLPDDDGGYGADAAYDIAALLPKMDAVLIGPGIGRGMGAKAVTEYVLTSFQGPVVLDADGMNCICAHKDILRGRTCPTVLTPHAGEFARLMPTLTGDRLKDAKTLAEETGSVVVLKGHRTVVTDGVSAYLNTTGNPGMAVGGSGDVLAGIIVSLIGQKLPALEASACGVWLHGASGDLCAETIGQYGMVPTDMLNVLPRLMK